MTSTGASHTITFSRLRANFTVDKELIGKQDPYVIFQSGSSRAQTKAIKGVGTGTAEWKETYTLEKFSPSSSTVIEVTVYNHNTLLPDNVIGAGTVDLSSQGQSSLSGSGEPISVILTDKKGQETGTISFVTNGGGYSGRGGASSGVGSGTSGVSSGTGYGSAAGVGTGAGLASGTSGTGTKSGTGLTSGTGTGSGYGSGTGTGTGSGYGSGTGTGTGYGSGTGAGYGSGTSGTGSVVGTGVGSDKRTAQQASDAAAREGREVTIEEGSRVGVGRPTGGSTTGSTTGATSGVTSGVGTERDAIFGVKEGDVIDRKYYVGTESRPQDQALVEQYREHNPYAKDYETTVQHTGRERLVNSQIEALGTRERVIGQDHHVHAHPVSEIARHLPASGAVIPGVSKDAGAMAERPGGEGWVQTKPGPICDTNTFSITGDRTVDKERVTDLREHREFEKEFEVKTRLVGERVLDRGVDAISNDTSGAKSGATQGAEILNRERVLVDEKDKIACEGHPSASVAGSGQTLASTGTGAGYGSGTGVGTTGTGYGSQTGTGYGSGTGTTGAGYGSQTGTGYGSGVGSGTGSGYGSGTGTGTGRSTTGEKIAGYIPGTEENQDKKQGYQPGTGPAQNQGNVTTGEKVASYIPGTEENKEKKSAQYA